MDLQEVPLVNNTQELITQSFNASFESSSAKNPMAKKLKDPSDLNCILEIL